MKAGKYEEKHDGRGGNLVSNDECPAAREETGDGRERASETERTRYVRYGETAQPGDAGDQENPQGMGESFYSFAIIKSGSSAESVGEFGLG